MTLIAHSKNLYQNNLLIKEEDPETEYATNVYYSPPITQDGWGIFYSDSLIVEACAERWLPQLYRLRQSGQSATSYAQASETVSDDYEYIYGGWYNPHFGHFLTESLSRLWPFAETGLKENQKVIFHGYGSPSEWFQHDYVRDLFGLLNITPDRIVHSNTPFRIPRLTIPGASFITQAVAYRAFSRFGLTLGERLMAGRPAAQLNNRPVYFSKSHLQTGVQRIVNEDAILAVMERKGVEVLYPELLSIREKIDLFTSRGVISGWCMSGHHIGLFTPKCARFEFLSPPVLNENFLLFDGLTGHNANYWYTPELTGGHREGSTFFTEVTIENAEEIAYSLLEKFN